MVTSSKICTNTKKNIVRDDDIVSRKFPSSDVKNYHQCCKCIT